MLATCLTLATMPGAARATPEIPGPPQERAVVITGATVHPVSGPAIENGIVLFDKGKLVAVGKEVTIPEGAERIDATGKHIYPGLIDANTQIGLVEIPSVRGTRDQAETGDINPNVKGQVAFNPDSELIPVTRSGGVLTVLTVPTGGVISGQSACMVLDGWTWEDMCLKPGVGMHINWPQMAPVDAWWVEQTGAAQVDDRDRALKTLRKAMTDARAYLAAKTAHAAGAAAAPDHDIRWEAMIPVLKGEQPVFIEAEDAQQIQSALAFCEKEKLKPVIVGGYDAPDCAALLKKMKAPVIVGGVHRLPRRRSDAYDAPFTVAARLHEAGVPFCIAGSQAGSSGSTSSNVRNLPYNAGAAAAYGLPPEEALKAVTLYAAQILGVADRVGSLEAGKDATLIITTGDPLDIPTQVTAAYIQGRPVSLNDRHKRLWEKYKEKYRRMGVKN